MSEHDRIVVVGNSGSGKTRVARALAEGLGVPHLEMDSVRHRDGWDSVGAEEFSAVVSAFTSGKRWVADGNYTSLGTETVVWPRADTIVWLDLPRAVVMRRVIGRTLRRVLTRDRLWGGQREPLTNLYRLDPYQNIIVWAWTRHSVTRSRFEEALGDGSWSHAEVHRLCSQAEVDRFLEAMIDRAAD